MLISAKHASVAVSSAWVVHNVYIILSPGPLSLEPGAKAPRPLPLHWAVLTGGLRPLYNAAEAHAAQTARAGVLSPCRQGARCASRECPRTLAGCRHSAGHGPRGTRVEAADARREAGRAVTRRRVGRGGSHTLAVAGGRPRPRAPSVEGLLRQGGALGAALEGGLDVVQHLRPDKQASASVPYHSGKKSGVWHTQDGSP